MRNLSEALPCFSHASFIIPHLGLSFLPANVFQISPLISILADSVCAKTWIMIAAHIWSLIGEPFTPFHNTNFFLKANVFISFSI